MVAKLKEKFNSINVVRNYRKIFPYVRPYWWRALLSILITIPIGSMDAVIAWSLKPYMDVVMVEKSTQATNYIPVLIIVFSCLQSLLKSGDIVLYKQLKDIGDIFWGDMYLLSIDIDGEEYITVKYIQKSEREGYVKLVSQNPHHADKEVAVDRIRALALVKASIRMNSIR